jgi:hypothetical protein
VFFNTNPTTTITNNIIKILLPNLLVTFDTQGRDACQNIICHRQISVQLAIQLPLHFLQANYTHCGRAATILQTMSRMAAALYFLIPHWQKSNNHLELSTA